MIRPPPDPGTRLSAQALSRAPRSRSWQAVMSPLATAQDNGRRIGRHRLMELMRGVRRSAQHVRR